VPTYRKSRSASALGGTSPGAARPKKRARLKVMAAVGVTLLALLAGYAAGIGNAFNGVGEAARRVGLDVGRAGVNEPISLRGTTYQMTGARTASSIGDGFTDATANGTFVIVDLALTNEGERPATVLVDRLRVIGGNGSSYSVSDDALLRLDNQEFLFDEQIQPGLAERGTLVYDLPPQAVAGGELQVNGSRSQELGRIALGL